MADERAELHVAVVTMDLLDADPDVPRGPCVILTGNATALKEAAKLMFQPVKIVPVEDANG